MMISVWSPTSSYTSTIILIEPMQIPHHHDHLGGYHKEEMPLAINFQYVIQGEAK